MIYVIPHSRDNVANHFMKARKFTFLNDDNTVIKTVDSPAAGNSSCSDKSKAIKLIQEMKVDAVILHNIGERSLGKLLNAGIRVFQLQENASVSNALNSPVTELTDVKQARPSHNHEKKGGSCCGSHNKDTAPRIGQQTMTSALNKISSIRPVN
ncbi:dinitrogenase iron-molybdenum cofactor [Vibrio albus]|jgi:predicted Fe-Mo cluster-binding NifX family protein|uniref:Dinitrogenase iron-molybdenum cofactor n=1 Tax=Vibrio albus TaxID=2200953 RepID=A0A2U3BCL6_9VIBR|nr:NifB/NifX family molybdenum-iron cluster-binding protein [Vibrio albus]PWI34529.1 dinitrogenase iron-molybdenum cofactor [Vibrio albus]